MPNNLHLPLRIFLSLFLMISLTAGCQQTSLVKKIKSHGINDQATGKIIIRGSEADVGPNINVVITEQFVIQKIWDKIYESRPTSIWYASGYRQVDFYKSSEDIKPLFTLLVNESDASHIKGTTNRFRCPGLAAFASKMLLEEYKRQK